MLDPLKTERRRFRLLSDLTAFFVRVAVRLDLDGVLRRTVQKVQRSISFPDCTGRSIFRCSCPEAAAGLGLSSSLRYCDTSHPSKTIDWQNICNASSVLIPIALQSAPRSSPRPSASPRPPSLGSSSSRIEQTKKEILQNRYPSEGRKKSQVPSPQFTLH